MQEIFKSVTGYDGYYEVSNCGRLKSLAKRWSVGIKGETFLKSHSNKLGYCTVTLCVDKVKKLVGVHRLVAKEFCENPNNYDVVNHLDSNPSNNVWTNLEWTTTSGNAIHGYGFGFREAKKGESSHYAKLTEREVLKIRFYYKTFHPHHKELAKMYNVSRGTITKIILRKRWAHI